MFSEKCEIFYPNDLVLETTIFNRGRCSNVLCSTVEGVCSNDRRCCCQDLVVSHVNYSCPNMTFSSGVVGMVEQCLCQLCTNVSVVFVGRVIDQREIPVIIANITVNREENYITDELGFFAFSVSAKQETVSIRVSGIGYLTSERIYSVLPGGMRTIEIVLKELLAVTMRPPEGDFYQSVTTLQVLSSTDEAALPAGESRNDDSRPPRVRRKQRPHSASIIVGNRAGLEKSSGVGAGNGDRSKERSRAARYETCNGTAAAERRVQSSAGGHE